MADFKTGDKVRLRPAEELTVPAWKKQENGIGEVRGATHGGNWLTVRWQDGKEFNYPPDNLLLVAEPDTVAFRAGEQVRLKPRRELSHPEWKDQEQGIGVVREDEDPGYRPVGTPKNIHWVRIRWENGSTNAYYNTDLVRVLPHGAKEETPMAAWYAVPRGMVDDKQVKALAKAKIPVLEHTVRDAAVLAFPGEYREAADTILETKGYAEDPKTGVEGVVLLVVPKAAQQVTYQTALDRERITEAQWAKLLPVLSRFADTYGTSITVHNPHHAVHPPQGDRENLHILFWSRMGKKGETSDTHVIPRAFGHPLKSGAQGDGLEPSGKADVVLHDPDGVAVAEAVEGTLYILFDIVHGATIGATLLGEILDLYAQAFPPRPLTEEEKAERLAIRLRETRKAYIKACAGQLQVKQAENANAIKRAREELATYLKAIPEKTREVERLETEGWRLNHGYVDEQEERFSKEFDTLLSFPTVDRITVEDGQVVVYTIPLEVTAPYNNKPTIFELGPYRIVLGKKGDVVIHCVEIAARTGQTHYQHPHVLGPASSDICFGNAASGIYQLLGSYEYAVAVQMIIEFLQTVVDHGGYMERLKMFKTRRPADQPKEEVQAPSGEGALAAELAAAPAAPEVEKVKRRGGWPKGKPRKKPEVKEAV